MDLSIIIVNHNTKELTKSAICSVINHTSNISYEFIIVDNSTDENKKISQNFFEDVSGKVVYTSNKGFGNACNLGAKNSKGDILLFLNSDTLVKDNSLFECVNYIKNAKNLGVLGAKTISEEGKIDSGCKRGFPTPFASLCYFLHLDKIFPNNKKIGAYHQTFIKENETSFVDIVSGSCMFIKRDIFFDVNGFDEDFFMYGEDVDICYRIKQKGLNIIYFPKAYIIHLKGKSGLSSKSSETIFNFYDSMKKFYNKHYKEKYNKLTTKLVMSAINFKYKLSLKKSK